jgi:hypothetical protein
MTAEENEHVRKLNEARALAVKARREAVDELTASYKRKHAENKQDVLIKLQNTIEAIDRAIADERELGGQSVGRPIGYAIDLADKSK